MRLIHVAILAVGLASASVPADPPKRVRLPQAPSLPQPMPSPDAPIALTPELLLVCDSDVDCVVVCSPRGKLKITPAKGQVTVRGKFVDGTGQVEMRTFAGPFVWFVEAQETGECELLVLPVGGKESDLLRRRIISQTAPQPPPKPVDPVDPPKPDAPIPAAGLRVLIVYESADLSKYTPQTNGILFGKAVRDYLQANCVVGPDGKTKEFRIWDKDLDGYGDSKLWGDAMKRPRSSVPWVIISNGKTGYEGPLPENADKFLELVKKYGG